jgi:SAM-dependent methyltransferase
MHDQIVKEGQMSLTQKIQSKQNTKLSDRTIKDFGEQWTTYTDNADWYGANELFRDYIQPLLDEKELKGSHVVDIGSGTGRIVAMILNAGAVNVTAVEPSSCFAVMQKYLAVYGDRVRCMHLPGDQFSVEQPVDYVISLGVLHHIPDPGPVVEAAYRALKPGGRFLVWLYGKEGNAAYLMLVQPLRLLTTKLPHVLLVMLTRILDVMLVIYMRLCTFLNLPLKSYLLNVIRPLSTDKRRLVIYDQLKPAYAKYYTQVEAENLLKGGGFVHVKTYHRRGYSWSVIGTKPE